MEQPRHLASTWGNATVPSSGAHPCILLRSQRLGPDVEGWADSWGCQCLSCVDFGQVPSPHFPETLTGSMGLPHKTKNVTLLWPSNSTSGNISEEAWNTNLKEYMYPYLRCSVIYNWRGLEVAQVSISRRGNKKLWYLKEILPFLIPWIDLEIIMLSEIGQSEKDKNHMISLICGT